MGGVAARTEEGQTDAFDTDIVAPLRVSIVDCIDSPDTVHYIAAGNIVNHLDSYHTADAFGGVVPRVQVSIVDFDSPRMVHYIAACFLYQCMDQFKYIGMD